MKRIFHFAQDDDTSGFFPQLARLHDRNRFEMLFGTLNPIAPWLRDYMEGQGVRCISLDCRSRSEYSAGLLRLAAVLRRERVDILHTHLFEPSVIGLGAGYAARTPLRVLTRHYSDYHTRINKRWHVRLDQMCTGLSHGVIAVSQHTADHMISEENAPPEKVRVIMNGIDFERVRVSGPEAAARVRAQFDVGDGYLLLVAARLHPEKGYEYLFRAMPAIRRMANRPVTLVVAGKGTYEAEYRSLVQELGCGEQVQFLGFRKDLPDLMAAADLFVLPSLAEAFGLVLTEAIYLGTPVVASRTGGIPEIVEEGVDGVLVPAGDSDALAAAIVDRLHDPDRGRLGERARERITNRFDFGVMLRSYEGFYQELEGRTRGRLHG